MNSAQLLVVLHAHQPVGRSDEEVAAAHAERYRPLFDALLAQPKVRLTLALSGALLEWLESDEPASAQILRELIDREQVELLGGGAYEPLLTLLTDWDAQSQLTRMQELVVELGVPAPTGAWIPQGVFEADLPRILGPAGLHHAVLSPSPTAERVLGYSVVERAGHPLAIFATQAVVAEAWRDGRLDAVRAELAAASDATVGRGGRGVCLALDVDQLDPATLAERLTALTELGPDVELLTLANYRARFPARAFARVASAGPEALRAGVHLAVRPEARALHERMLHASKKLLEAETEQGVGTGSLAESRRALMRGQGYFDPGEARLRHAAFAHLIESENLVDEEQRGEGDYIEYEEDDFDADLRDEAVLANAQIAAWVDPEDGGTLTELDDRSHALAQIQVLPGSASEETVGRRSFVDRFPSASMTLEQLASDHGTETGDFASSAYLVEASGVDEEGDLSASITMVREAQVRTAEGSRPLLIEKTYHVPVDAPRLEVEYILENPSDSPLSLLFAPELHLCPFGGEGAECVFDLGEGRREGLGQSLNLGVRTGVVLQDAEAGTRLSIGADHESEIWTYPVRRAGVYQGTCLSLRQTFTLPPKESRRLRFTVQITDLE